MTFLSYLLSEATTRRKQRRLADLAVAEEMLLKTSSANFVDLHKSKMLCSSIVAHSHFISFTYIYSMKLIDLMLALSFCDSSWHLGPVVILS